MPLDYFFLADVLGELVRATMRHGQFRYMYVAATRNILRDCYCSSNYKIVRGGVDSLSVGSKLSIMLVIIRVLLMLLRYTHKEFTRLQQ